MRRYLGDGASLVAVPFPAAAAPVGAESVEDTAIADSSRSASSTLIFPWDSRSSTRRVSALMTTPFDAIGRELPQRSARRVRGGRAVRGWTSAAAPARP